MMVILGVLSFFVPKAYCFDDDLQEKTWHTASAHTYVIYKIVEWAPHATAKAKKEPGKLFVITYITSHKPDERSALLEEYYDLMTHFYHFYLPQNLKSKTKEEKNKYYVMVESLQQKPKPGEKNIKTLNFTKNLNGVADIAAKHKGLDQTRFDALKALNGRQYKKAKSLFQQIKNQVAQDYVHMSNVSLVMGNREEAKKEIEAGLQKFPSQRDLLHSLVNVTILEGTFVTDGKYEYDPQKMEEAKKILRQVMDMKKDDYLAHSTLATVEMALKNYDGAEKILKDLISKSSHPWQLQKRLGDLYVLSGKSKEAEQSYLEAIKLKPQEPTLLVKVGEFYHGEGKFEEAEKYYTAAITRLEGRNPTSEIKKHLQLAKEKKALKAFK